MVHSHGLWRMPNLYADIVAHRWGVPHVISPRGMLSNKALSFSVFSKWAFQLAGQRRALSRARAFHATSQAEAAEIRALGFQQPIIVLPNGVDMPPSDPARHPTDENMRTLLYFGRIHPKKGVDDLIDAWLEVAAMFPQWRLQIVGPGEPQHLSALNDRIRDIKDARIEVRKGVFGSDKWRVFRDSDIFVLPTYSENFGLTVGESLACGRPVIVSKGAPWSDVVRKDCGWWVDIGAKPLAAAFKEALSSSRESLLAKGERGSRWINSCFSWESVAHSMSEAYHWLRFGGTPPDFILFD